MFVRCGWGFGCDCCGFLVLVLAMGCLVLFRFGLGGGCVLIGAAGLAVSCWFCGCLYLRVHLVGGWVLHVVCCSFVVICFVVVFVVCCYWLMLMFRLVDFIWLLVIDGCLAYVAGWLIVLIFVFFFLVLYVGCVYLGVVFVYWLIMV